RAPRRWYVPVAAGIALTWVIIADRVALLDAVVPLVLVCGARALLAVLRHRKSLASQWYDPSLVAASVLSFVMATLAVVLISGRGCPRGGAAGRRGPGGVGLLPRVPVLFRPQRPDLPRPGHGDRRQRGRLCAQHRFRRPV